MQMAMKLGDRVDPSVADAPATRRAKGKKLYMLATQERSDRIRGIGGAEFLVRWAGNVY